jgi:hypothetical protein
MSGQPCINPSDSDVYRKAYLDTLAVQIANNDANYQANKLHQRTGQVATQITDYRSTAEKMADITSMRVLVKAELRRLMDEPNTERTMTELSDDEVLFVSQSIEAIAKELLPKYKQGVESAVFLDYVKALMKKPALALVGGSRESAGPAVLDVAGIDEDELEGQITLTRRLLPILKRIRGDLADRLYDQLRYQSDRLEAIFSNLLPYLNQLNVAVRGSASRLVRQSYQHYPNTDQLEKTGRALELSRDRGYLEQVMLQLMDMTMPTGADDDMLRRAEALISYTLQQEVLASEYEKADQDKYLLQAQLGEARGETSEAYSIAGRLQQQILELQKQLGEATSKSEEARLTEQIARLQTKLDDLTGAFGETASRLEEAVKSLPEPNPELRGVAGTAGGKGSRIQQVEILKAYMTAGLALMNKGVPNAFRNDKRGKLRLNSEGATDSMDALQIADLYDQNYDRMKEFYEQFTRPARLPRSRASSIASSYGSASSSQSPSPREAFKAKATPSGAGEEPPSRTPTSGRGLSVAEGKGVAHKKVAPFGRYLIHLSKLNDDVICLSTKQGTNVPSYRTLRVSVPVANIIRKIVNGRNPSYEDIQKLGEEDKAEIHKVFKKAHIVMGEGLEIPKPTQQVEDLNRFTILKGEILAGNDGVETIKQFKLLVLKLMNSGHLPRGQAKDLLVDLANLGY